MKWIISFAAGLGVLAAAGGYDSLSPMVTEDIMEFAGAAAIAGVHTLIWAHAGAGFRLLRYAIWSAYGLLLLAFLVSYFPNGILPILWLLMKSITLPAALGFLSVAIPARFIGAARTPSNT